MKFSVYTNQADSSCARRRALERWTRRKLGSIEHELRVASIAGKLFDLTWPLHGLRRSDRKLLLMGAIVHDVGRCLDDDTHPKQGAILLRDAEALPLSAAERRALVYLTRHHRGDVPELGADSILRASDHHESLRKVLAILRAADTLDSRSIESPTLVFELNRKRLNITCCLDDLTPKALAVYGRRKKYRLLEDLLQIQVQVRIVANQQLRVVA